MRADVQIANVEQAAAWDGHEGDMWTEQADRYERAGSRHWARFIAAGLIGERDAVLDIGCGTGRPTRDAARIAKHGSALGLDLSTRMLQHARQRSTAEGLTNIAFVQGDAQVFDFDAGTYDIAISSFGAMFFNDPVAAFSNIARATRARGRLALLAWRELPSNAWLVSLRAALAAGRELPLPPPDAPTPFSLADPTRVRQVLGAAGYRDVDLTAIDEPMDLGPDVEEAYAFARTMGIVEALTQDLDEHTRGEVFSSLQEMLAAHETDAGVLLGSAAWLITAEKR
jgi:SAM-dependent methyltransferase